MSIKIFKMNLIKHLIKKLLKLKELRIKIYISKKINNFINNISFYLNNQNNLKLKSNFFYY
jgi:hypothetical protein